MSWGIHLRATAARAHDDRVDRPSTTDRDRSPPRVQVFTRTRGHLANLLTDGDSLRSPRVACSPARCRSGQVVLLWRPALGEHADEQQHRETHADVHENVGPARGWSPHGSTVASDHRILQRSGSGENGQCGTETVPGQESSWVQPLHAAGRLAERLSPPGDRSAGSRGERDRSRCPRSRHCELNTASPIGGKSLFCPRADVSTSRHRGTIRSGDMNLVRFRPRWQPNATARSRPVTMRASNDIPWTRGLLAPARAAPDGLGRMLAECAGL